MYFMYFMYVSLHDCNVFLVLSGACSIIDLNSSPLSTCKGAAAMLTWRRKTQNATRCTLEAAKKQTNKNDANIIEIEINT